MISRCAPVKTSSRVLVSSPSLLILSGFALLTRSRPFIKITHVYDGIGGTRHYSNTLLVASAMLMTREAAERAKKFPWKELCDILMRLNGSQ
jgi:hypothetical protein